MSHKRTNVNVLENTQKLSLLSGGEIKIGSHGTAGTGVTQELLSSALVTEELTVAASAVTITDVGDANGGYGALKLVTLAAAHLLFLGAYIDIAITGDGAGTAADAAVDIGVGTAAEAANSTIDGTSADIIDKIDAPLTASVGAAEGVGLPSGTPVVVDATGGTQGIYLNIGIPDADISASGTMAVAGTVRLIYLDISKGA